MGTNGLTTRANLGKRTIKLPDRKDRTLISVITHLASLVSDPQEVDPLLDTLRVVTAKMPHDRPIPPEDYQRLLRVKDELCDYLVKNDSIRSFTYQSLQKEVDFFLAKSRRRRSRLTPLRGTVCVLVAASLSYVVGLLALPMAIGPRKDLSIVMFAALLYVGVVWLFWTALKNFTAQFRQAYVWICAGYIITAFGVGLAPLVLAFPSLSYTILFRYGVIAPIFLMGSVFIYRGVYISSRTLGTKSIVAKYWPVVLATACISTVIGLLPHPTHEPSQLFYVISAASLAGAVALSLLSSYLSFRIAKLTTANYSQAMGWLGATMVWTAVPHLVHLIYMYNNGLVAGRHYALISMLFMIPAGLLIVSAYEFRRSSGKTVTKGCPFN